MSNSGFSASLATSSSLIRRVQQQDPEAWERLAKLYGPLVYRWCRLARLQPHDAADVVQEVFLAVARSIHAFRHKGEQATFRGWLWTIARNQVRLFYRRREGRALPSGGTTAAQALAQVPALLDDDSEPSDFDADAGLAHRALDIARGEFEERTWQAFWRLAIEGRPASEIAEELQMTPGAVRQAKYRVLVRLRELIEGG